MTVSEQWRNAFVLCPATDLEVVERMAQRAEEAGYAATLVGARGTAMEAVAFDASLDDARDLVAALLLPLICVFLPVDDL